MINKISLYLAILTLSLSALIGVATPQIAEAAVPSLAFASAGTNMVLVSVYGDPNQAVNLYYYNIGSSIINSVGSIGTTNSTGYFSNTLNSGSYNIPSGASVYVVVNGQQSSNSTWPSIAGGNVFLSQSNVSMNQGQSTSVSISGGNGSGYYVNSNSNSGIVGTSISGSILTLNAVGTGYATISVCSLGTTTTCTSVAVTVNSTYGGNYGTGSIYLSPSSVTVAPGQSQTVYINSYNNGTYYGSNYGSQNYYISNNPGSQFFSASISGNTVIIYGNSVGSATINICSQYGSSSCASLYVTVSGSYYNGNYNNGNYYNGSNYYNGYNGYNSYNYGTGGFTYTSYPSNYTYPATYTNPVTYTYPTNTYTNYSGSSYNSGSNVGRSVSGVFLSQVPSTGIAFGFKMALFTTGLLLWSLFAAFMIARKKEVAVVASVSSVPVISTSNKVSKIESFKLANMKKKGLI
ncbi:MAG: hypothetical protein K9M11_02055 [Candidatus Pacebacteria bacterium]|nr:hypothetical protein [Candidatus Paceibacterota bacterium]